MASKDRSSLTQTEATRLAKQGELIYHVANYGRTIGWYTDEETATQLAEFYDASVFDWATGERI